VFVGDGLKVRLPRSQAHTDPDDRHRDHHPPDREPHAGEGHGGGSQLLRAWVAAPALESDESYVRLDLGDLTRFVSDLDLPPLID
jgi:hypothetical protein